LVRTRGKNRALIAVAHSLLVTVYSFTRAGELYRDLGLDYFVPWSSASKNSATASHSNQRPQPPSALGDFQGSGCFLLLRRASLIDLLQLGFQRVRVLAIGNQRQISA
jgi:hypothetical protein